MIEVALRCSELVNVITEWMEGAMPEGRCAELEEHLAICPHCVHYLDQIRFTTRLLAALDDSVLPPSGESHERLVRAFRSWTG